MTLDKVLAALPSLSKRDLQVVRGAADKLLGASAATAGPLYGALQTVTGSQLPFSKFQKSAAYKSWPENEKFVMNFVHRAWPDLKKVQENAVLISLVDLLASDLRARGIKDTIGVVAMNLGSLGDVFDYSYPDYRKCGLTEIVLKTMVRK